MSFSKIKKFMFITLLCSSLCYPCVRLSDILVKDKIHLENNQSYYRIEHSRQYLKELPMCQSLRIGFFYLTTIERNALTWRDLSYLSQITVHKYMLSNKTIPWEVYDYKNDIKKMRNISLKGGLKMETDRKDSNQLEENTKKKDDNSLKSWLQTILVAIILAAIIKHFIFNTTLVKGPSMEPTLHENDRMICLVFPLYYSNPERGDIIILDAPDEKKEYVKRVIGIPGDEIEIVNGKVYVNGEVVNESYIDSGLETLTNFENRWTLDEDDYFVLGDNRHPSKSVDSRYFGPIPRSSIRSIAKFRYFPFSRVGTL